MRQRGVVLAFALFLLVVLSSQVMANFACGEVISSGDFSPDWIKVNVRYVSSPQYSTSCEVSPEGGKYCCDPRDIDQVGWQVGKVLNAQVFDEELGIFSQPEELSITGEGFDVFAPLEINKAIYVHTNISKIMIREDNLDVNFSSDPYFNRLSYGINHSGEYEEIVLCQNCNNYDFNLNVSDRGNYDLYLIAENDQKRMSKKFHFTNFEFLNLKRELICQSCLFENGYWKVPSETEVGVKITINTSHEIDDVFYDHFHNSWEYISGGNLTESQFKNYNRVFWNVYGTSGEFQYFLKSPEAGIFPRGYGFAGFVSEDYKANVERARVFGFFNFLRVSFFNEEPNEKSSDIEGIKVLRSSPARPIVLFTDQNQVSEIAIFPRKESGDSTSYVNFNPERKKLWSDLNFEVVTDLDDISRVVIRFNFEEIDMENRIPVLYHYENGEWESTEIKTNGNFYFAESEKGGNFALDFRGL